MQASRWRDTRMPMRYGENVLTGTERCNASSTLPSAAGGYGQLLVTHTSPAGPMPISTCDATHLARYHDPMYFVLPSESVFRH